MGIQKEGYKLDLVSVRLVKDTSLLSEHQIKHPEDAVAIMADFLCEMDREVLCILNLKSDGTPINGHIASIGALNQTMAHPRELLKTAILSNAASMIMLHCHPSGSLTPSKEDVQMTDRMIQACDLVGIPLIDHIIVGNNCREMFSFHEKSLLAYSNREWHNDYHLLKFKGMDDFSTTKWENMEDESETFIRTEERRTKRKCR